jgi:Type II secretion system (T2SS), protein N
MPASRSPNRGAKSAGVPVKQSGRDSPQSSRDPKQPGRHSSQSGRNSPQSGRNPGTAGRGLDDGPRARSYWPFVLLGVTAVLAVIVAALPASLVTHFLPPSVHAEDFSGSIWHGSTGNFSVGARPAGALEWHVHPQALLGMAVAADLHWVKVGFVIDAAVTVDRRGLVARGVKGGGPVDDLGDLGVAPGWRGTAYINFSEVKSDFVKLLTAAGELKVAHLTSAQFGDGADLGSYDLVLPEGAIGADGNLNAQLTDDGGPLDAQAVVRFSQTERTGTLSGTVKERPGVPPALHEQLQNLTQLHARDGQGRIPIDMEFTLPR